MKPSTVLLLALAGCRSGEGPPASGAQLLAVRGNPLEDVGALGRVVFVLRGGEVVLSPR